MSDAVEIWRGGVNTWDCDEMGHMNVRHYVVRFMEGLGGLARRLGLPDAFSPHANATLLVREHHIRFLKEAHAGAPLHMVGGVVAMGPTTATLLQVLVHTRSGETCATCLTEVEHATSDGRPFDWPARSLAAAAHLQTAVPQYAAPRSIGSGAVMSLASLERADEMAIGCAGRSTIMAYDCDAFGRMRPEIFIGKVSDGVSGLLAPVRQAVRDNSPDGAARVGGAVLEYRLIYLEWPRMGDHIELRSGLKSFGEKTQTMVHWLLDPVAGRPWGVAEAVAVNLDLDARKVIPIAPEARQALAAYVIPNLEV